jgi:hypothetical protein
MKVMNGLRMFIRLDKGSVEDNVFYSQRSRGPIYRWHYENNPAKWHVARVDVSDWSAHEFCIASWQSVPHGLKTQLSEHYIESLLEG